MITIITPTVRPDGVKIIAKCLRRQDFTDWEWIITSPEQYSTRIEEKLVNTVPHKLLIDPPKKKGDFWSLCKGWNNAYAHAQGDLIVNIQDMIWFAPDTLSRFWFHYQNNPRTLVGALGHQYSTIDSDGKPINLVWNDPRYRTDITFQEVPPSEMEMTMCSVPKQAILECGGIDEDYDKGPGAQEKEMCWRLNKMNWDFYLDHTIEYRAIYHPRLTNDWDEKYRTVITPLFVRHMNELTDGTRTLNVNNILKYLKQ